MKKYMIEFEYRSINFYSKDIYYYNTLQKAKETYEAMMINPRYKVIRIAEIVDLLHF